MVRPFLSRGCSLMRNLDVISYIPKDLLNLQTTCRSLGTSAKRILTPSDAETLVDKPDLRRLLESGFYVDKTMYVQEILKIRDPCYIARPRKFGKTLFIETLASVCRGERELFRDCHISKPENGYEWAKYPVVKLDFSAVTKDTPKQLCLSIEDSIKVIASEYGVELNGYDAYSNFCSLVRRLACLGGDWAPEVVVLIDNYDSPISYSSEGSTKNAPAVREFLTKMKSVQEHLRLAFVTGITTLESLDWHSEGHLLVDITLDKIADNMFGFTREELRNTFSDSIEAVASAWPKSRGEGVLSDTVLYEMIECFFYGYKFCEYGMKVYNPYAIMHFLASGELYPWLGRNWFDTTCPDFIVDQIMYSNLKKFEMDVHNSQVEISKSDILKAGNRTDDKLWPSMFFAGYLTIDSYNESTEVYSMRFTNAEVRIGLKNSLRRRKEMLLRNIHNEERVYFVVLATFK